MARATLVTQKHLDFIKKVTESNGKNWTNIRKEFGIYYELARKLMEDANIPVPGKKEASLDKVLSEQEVLSRVPSGTVFLGMEGSLYVFRCPEGHVYKKNSSHLSQGCPVGRPGRKSSVEDVQKSLENIGYDMDVDSYVKKRTPFNAKCLKCGNIRTAKYRNFFLQSCATCNNKGTSGAESEIGLWIKSLNLEIEKLRLPGNKTKKKEIDIYIRSCKVGIEYCGLYWHCENSPHPRLKGYHAEKMHAAQSLGIRLITVFEDEWLERKEQVKNFLTSVLGKNQVKIGARRCEVVFLNKKESDAFFEQNHIQGRSRAFMAVGLRYEGKLIGATSFSHHHRKVSGDAVVLDRMAFAHGYTVGGGASKMISFAIPALKDAGFSKIISWSDNRWSQGAVYESTGFSLEGNLDPDYSYVKKGARYSKQSLKKSGEEKLSGKTEKELRKEQGYDRIWDCGKKRWVLDIS